MQDVVTRLVEYADTDDELAASNLKGPISKLLQQRRRLTNEAWIGITKALLEAGYNPPNFTKVSREDRNLLCTKLQFVLLQMNNSTAPPSRQGSAPGLSFQEGLADIDDIMRVDFSAGTAGPDTLRNLRLSDFWLALACFVSLVLLLGNLWNNLQIGPKTPPSTPPA